ncbi:hypothetical protein COW95_00695, partial [Candidatus Peregrinibacteria bacterium CG22_combo_CG10-13_8_21_14_all_49_11]
MNTTAELYQLATRREIFEVLHQRKPKASSHTQWHVSGMQLAIAVGIFLTATAAFAHFFEKSETFPTITEGRSTVRRIHRAAPPPPSSAPTIRDEEPTLPQSVRQRGVYMTATSVSEQDFFEKKIQELIDAGGTTFIMDVKGAYVYFNALSPLAQELKLVQPLYNLPEIIQEAKKRGLYTAVRFLATKDPLLASRHPDARMKNPQTGIGIQGQWVDPSHPTVLRYNEEILREVVAAGVDEINIDYIRYPTEYPMSWVGLTAQERADRLEKWLKMARRVIDEVNPDVQLGISTFAILGWNFEVNVKRLGQDVPRFAPLVDVISPMAYPVTFAVGHYYNPAKHPRSRMYYLVWKTLEGYKQLVGPKHAHKIRPWIQGYYTTPQN